jgi:hypothetical protein
MELESKKNISLTYNSMDESIMNKKIEQLDYRNANSLGNDASSLFYIIGKLTDEVEYLRSKLEEL